MTTKEKEQLSHAESNAAAWFEIIAEWETLYDWATNEEEPSALDWELRKQLKQLGWDGTDYQAVLDTVTEQVQEAPLSVQVRSDWQDPGDELEPAEFCILLSTGGPALRIIGSLNHHGMPDGASLQYQDWATPWTRYWQASAATLEWFACMVGVDL